MRVVDERYATILPGPGVVDEQDECLPDAIERIPHLRTLALELRDGLLALATGAATHEAAVAWEQAAKCSDYQIKRSEGATR